ncbi:MAG: murein biosynthesis integral membrane protein MurJ [Alphaproteobacteria bacterium]|nr:murein biosynthesis integral membrane protein MurJ [Alphaproteobacteria bacterium]
MSLLRSVATVGSYTLMSRVMGFVRDILTAALLGAGPVADAFFVAQRLPNLFRSLFAEGAFSAAFVPLFAGAMAQHGKENARIFAEDALAVLLAALVVFVLGGEIFMPSLMHLIAPGFSEHPEKFSLAIDLARITFPYLLFIALVALQGGVLNSVDRFAAAAATPTLLNLFLIAALLMMRRFGWHDGRALAWAITAAGLAQFLWLMFSCAQAGLALRLPWPRLTREVRRTLAIMGPGAVGAGVTQLNLMISTALASFLPGGSVSYLYYADRLNQLPLGVVGIAVGTAILPPLSRQLRLGEDGAAVATQNRGLELALLLTLPAAMGLVVLAQPILAILFQRGAFGASDTAATAAALAAYAAGLPAFVLIKVLAPAFFARHDTATPVKVAVTAMAVNLGLTVILMRFLAHVGIALATSGAGWLNALALLVLLMRRKHFMLDRRARRNLPRIAVAAIGMGVVLVLMRSAFAPALTSAAPIRITALAGLCGAGLAAFAILALALGVADWRDLRGRLRRQPA